MAALYIQPATESAQVTLTFTQPHHGSHLQLASIHLLYNPSTTSPLCPHSRLVFSARQLLPSPISYPTNFGFALKASTSIPLYTVRGFRCSTAEHKMQSLMFLATFFMASVVGLPHVAMIDTPVVRDVGLIFDDRYYSKHAHLAYLYCIGSPY